MSANEPMSDEPRSSFWADLNRHMQNPKFRRSYEEQARRLADASANEPMPDEHCPTVCDPDCDAGCHETHEVAAKRQHQPADCPGRRREPISPERLAQIRKECGPKSVYLSGVAGDGLVVMANELLDEIDRLTEVLDASRVVRNAAESSCRVYKAVVDRLKADRTRLRAELDRCAGLNRELVNEAADATVRAETAERELAEVRGRLGEGETPDSHCPWCGTSVQLGTDGLVPLHEHPAYCDECPGTGRRPSEAPDGQ